MPYIKVDTNKLNQYNAELKSIKDGVNTISRSFSSLAGSLDSDIKYRDDIYRKLNNINSTLSEHRTVISRMNVFLGEAEKTYKKTESAIAAGDKVAISVSAEQLLSITPEEAPLLQPLTTAIASNPAHISVIGGAVSGGSTEPQTGSASSVDPLRVGLELGGGLANIASKAIDHTKTMIEGIEACEITHVLKNGNMFLKGYKKGSGLTSKYNMSTWVAKGAKDGLKNASTIGKVADALGYIADGITVGLNAADLISSTWNDENKTTEKKVIDTVAVAGCSAVSMGIRVAGNIAGKVAGGAVASACCVVPIVGPALGAIAGIATSVAVGWAAGKVADLVSNPNVVAGVSNAIESAVNGVKAAAQVVSSTVQKVADKAKEVGKAVQATTKVVASAAQKVVTKAATVVTDTAKKVGNAVKNIFKGW